MKIKTLFIPAIIAALALSCAGTFTDSEYFSRLDAFISAGDYAQALVNIEEAKEKQKFAYKDRLLYYLDKGVLLSYQGDYEQSNQCLNDAETAMEELFTKSISSAAASFLLNDNILPYYGETYENIYVNIFKALNYLNLNKLDDAYVEVRRVNVKLVELEDKNKRLVESLNSAQDASIPFKMQAGNFYDDALAHYLSYLIFRAQGEPDNCRISLQKLQKAWDANGEIYNFSMPSVLKKELQAFEAGRGGDPQAMKNGRLALIAFVGNAPRKKAIGGLITTYDNAIGISELDVPIALPNIPFPGMKAGYHFKFAFPLMEPGYTQVRRIEVMIDNKQVGEMELLENLGQVAVQTFKSKMGIIYTKTLTRTVLKGLAATEAKKKLREETKANDFWGSVMDAMVDAGVDLTENADLRFWRTLPQLCFIGEFNLPPGSHSLSLRFMDGQGQELDFQQRDSFEIIRGLNLIDTALIY